jgi:hypothetical protein
MCKIKPPTKQWLKIETDANWAKVLKKLKKLIDG